jgi:flagellar assembly protein FliH
VYSRLRLVPNASGPEHTAPTADPIAEAHERAAEEGFASGYRAGEARAAEEAAAHLETWRATVAGASTLRGMLQEAYRRELVELALAVARAVLQQELRQDRTALQRVIGAALDKLGTAEPLIVEAGPEDTPEITRFAAQLREQGIDVTPRTNPALAAGDLRVESPSGSVEHLLEARLALARGLVLGELGGEAP